MANEHIDCVIELYNGRENVEKESFLADFEDMVSLLEELLSIKKVMLQNIFV